MSLLLFAGIAWGKRVDPVVTSDGRPRTGKQVQIAFTFTGIGEVKPVAEIKADGLVFALWQSFPLPPDRWQLLYNATPALPGKYDIPALSWSGSRGTAKSNAKAIRVTGPAMASPPKPQAAMPGAAKRDSATGGQDQLKWLESRVRNASPPPVRPAGSPSATPRPAKNAAFFFAVAPAVASRRVYLGESVPVDVRFYLRADKTFQDLLRPSFAGQGFLPGPVDELAPSLVTTNGADYHVIELLTTVVPLRTGPLEIPGMVLRGRHSGQSTDNSAPQPASWVPFELPTKSLKLEVRPLPAERPPDFTGGVGVFQARAPQIEPLPPRQGEPLNLRLIVEGNGNFRAMQPPVLDPATLEGWRVYEAGEKIEMKDAGGNGTKSFEFQLLPAKDVSATPAASLSFFDPQKARFVTLKFPSEPVSAKADTATPPPTAPATPPPTPAAAASPEQVTALPSSWTLRPWLFALLALLTFSLAAWLGLFLAKRQTMRAAEARRVRLRVEYEAARDELAAARADRARFYGAAARAVVAQLGLLHGKSLASDEIEEALLRLVPNHVLREDVSSVLRTSDELNYGAIESGPLTSSERESVRNLLEELDETCR